MNRNIINGRKLEEDVYDQINSFLSDKNDNYHNIKVKRPKEFDRSEGYASYHQIDNAFYYNGKFYIIECKYRRGRGRSGKQTCFWLPKPNSDDLWYDAKKATGKYLFKLWRRKVYFKSHKLYDFYGRPEIKLILLVDSSIKIGSKSFTDMAKVRDIDIIKSNCFSKYLRSLRVPYEEHCNNLLYKSSTGNEGGGV